MKLLLYALLFILWSTQTGICYLTDDDDCEVISDRIGFIREYYKEDYILESCWTFEVPQDSYLRISVDALNFRSMPCKEVYLNIGVDGTDESHTFCSDDVLRFPIVLTFLSDVWIKSILKPKVVRAQRSWQGMNEILPVSFNISYTRGNIICAQNNHFRCSEYSCVRQYQVCNGVEDCENGKDEDGCATGVTAVSGVTEARDRHVTRLRSTGMLSGWEENTPRAITALYLSGGVDFQKHRANSILYRYAPGSVEFQKRYLEEELMEKELHLKIVQTFLRHATEPMQVTELSVFLNALSVTCHNLRYFYGMDLLQMLGDRVINSKTPFPAASLTLCNANWTLPEHHVLNMLELLREESEYPFIQDIRATAVMALSCIKKKTSTLENIEFALETYNATIKKFISGQLIDGSFGTAYTTAIITQALIASGQESNSKWNVTATVKFLLSQLDSSVDTLATYQILPILNGKSLADLSDVNCVKLRKTRDDATRDLANKLEKRVQIQYSLYIGDLKDVIHTIYLRIAEKSSAYDVMKLAEENDHKYRFSHRYVASQLYVYSIAGIFNDPETLKFWLLYIIDSSTDGEMHHFAKSPDTVILRDGQHLIMWYKTVPMSKELEETVTKSTDQEDTLPTRKDEEDTVSTTKDPFDF